MSKVIVTMGISGSGKSRFCKSTFCKYSMGDLVYLSPDNIRNELTGDISNQEHNNEVFTLMNKRLEQALHEGVDILIDSTATNEFSRLEIINIVQRVNKNYKLELVVFMDSMHPEVCYSRVLNDIARNKDRSNTLGNDIIMHQYEAFKTALIAIKSESWDTTIIQSAEPKLNQK